MLARLRERCPGMLYSHKEMRKRAVVLPIGSLEDRPEGPAALDTLMAVAAACEASKLCGVAVTPPMSFGYSPKHRRWAGLRRGTLAIVITEVVTRLKESMMVPRVVIVDGHYGHKEVVSGAAMAAGAYYVNLWDVIVSEGITTPDEYEEFERTVAAEIAEEDARVLKRAIDAVARIICSLAHSS